MYESSGKQDAEGKLPLSDTSLYTSILSRKILEMEHSFGEETREKIIKKFALCSLLVEIRVCIMCVLMCVRPVPRSNDHHQGDQGRC